MPRPLPPGLQVGVIEPQDAVAAFNRRDLLLPSFNAEDVWQQEHFRGFASAGVMRYDVLQLLRDEVGIAQQAGLGGREFAKALRQRLAEKGFWGDVEVTNPATGEVRTTRFNDARLRLIHDVNLGQSYMAGKAERYQRTKRYLPFLQYRTMRDERVRASHRAWDNVVLPVDDPWWTLHHPRKAWRCRCDVAALSQRQVDRLRAAGLDIKTTPPEDSMVEHVDARTGETLRLPLGVDPAFAYHPGQRPLAGTVPPPLLGDPYDRQPTLQPAPALPTPQRVGPGTVLRKGTPPADAVNLFLAEFGAAPGKPVRWADVQGQVLPIDAELFRNAAGQLAAAADGREQWLLLLARALQQPDEIWHSFETRAANGAEELRRRYVARVLVERTGADPLPVAVVAELGKGGWLGQATTTPDELAADAALAPMRTGVRVYVRGGTGQPEGAP